MDPNVLWQQWPIAAVLIWFISAIARGVWVSKAHHQEIVQGLKDQLAKREASEEEYKDLAFKLAGLAKDVVEVAKSP